MKTGNIPPATFQLRVSETNEEGVTSYRWQETTATELFGNQKILLFSLPGAFTPTCSTYQLPDFEKLYSDFESFGFTAIFCISVNDAFVMNSWGQQLGINKVQLVPDGNGEFTRKMGMLIQKTNLGFGLRSWRYAIICNQNKIQKWFEEPGYEDNAVDDPYGQTSPQNILKFLANSAER